MSGNPKELEFLTGFVTEMKAALNEYPNALGLDIDVVSIVSCAACVLDPSSTPKAINASSEVLTKSEHWLAQAFCLDKGKKIIQMASENADRRSAQSSTLESIQKFISDLETMGFAELSKVDMEGEKKGMNAAYAKLLLKYLLILSFEL